jgi:mannonate dehydratase
MRETIALFDGLRSKLGFDVALCHDVHERLKPVDAIRLACELEPFDLFFLEDAIPLEEGAWIRQLREKTTTPLAQGELFNNPAEWKFLITEQLIDYIRVHLSQIGGITPGRKLQIFAEQFGVKTAWHGPGDMSPLGHAANIHIDLAARNFGVQEWSGIEPPNFVIQDLKGPRGALLDVFPGLPEFRDGYVYANDKPGLGVDIDEAEAMKYPCENTVTTWTQTRLIDGTLQTP